MDAHDGEGAAGGLGARALPFHAALELGVRQRLARVGRGRRFWLIIRSSIRWRSPRRAEAVYASVRRQGGLPQARARRALPRSPTAITGPMRSWACCRDAKRVRQAHVGLGRAPPDDHLASVARRGEDIRPHHQQVEPPGHPSAVFPCHQQLLHRARPAFLRSALVAPTIVTCDLTATWRRKAATTRHPAFSSPGQRGVRFPRGRTVGDARTVDEAVRLAWPRAHPGFRDPGGFGRRELDLPAAEIYDPCSINPGALAALARRAGARLQHAARTASYHSARTLPRSPSGRWSPPRAITLTSWILIAESGSQTEAAVREGTVCVSPPRDSPIATTVTIMVVAARSPASARRRR